MEAKINYFEIAEIQVTYKNPIRSDKRIQVQKAGDVAGFFEMIFEDFMQHHEEMYAMFLTAKQRVLGISQISRGSLRNTMCDVRQLFQVALKSNSFGIILVHNHPSGDPKPSESDLGLTKEVSELSKLHQMVLIDHVILSDTGYYSFAEEGLL